MSPKVPRLTARQIESVLHEQGFSLIKQSGSHKKWHHATKNASVIVPFHAGKTQPLGTMLSIMKSSKLPYDVWID